MAKALKYFYEFSDIDSDDYKVEIWVEGFAGTATELKAGGNPLTRTYNKDVGEKYLGGIVPFVVNIEAISSASFHAVDFTGENYGDAVVVVYKNTVLQYNAIIVPFEGADADLSDGIYSVNLNAECGLVNLKTITYEPNNTRKRLIDVIRECIDHIPYVNTFGYTIVDNITVKDSDGFTEKYYQSYVEDAFFEGLNCYDVINNIIQQYSQFCFTDARWDLKNISEISKGNSVQRQYSYLGILQATSTYTRPTEEVIRLSGGSFGLMFSSKNVIIEKTKSVPRSLNPNSGFSSSTGWTFAGSASSYFTIENGYLTNNAYTRFTTDTSPDDLSYVQSPATTYYPFNSIFDLSAKQELKVKFKSTKGLYIKHLRLQIVAVQGIIGAGDNIYYLTNEGTWYRSLPGYNTPIYQANFENNNDQIITIPQVPYIVPGTAPLEYNTIPDLGEFVPYPYNQPNVNAPYNIYVRVFLPERLYETYAPGTTDLDVTTEIDYIEITAEDVSTDILNGFTKKFGVVTQKDRNGDLTIKMGVGYPSYPISYDSLFFDGTTTKPITTYNDLPIEEFIAESYLSVLSQRQKFYQGTVKANIEFGDLLDIDGEKHRIHNFEYNYKSKQANVKTIGLGVNADTIEELPVYDIDINLDIDSILKQVNIDMNRRYGDNLNLKFVDKNIEIKTLADGQKTMSLRQDFRISTLYSNDLFLRTVSEGSIQDVAEDTEGNFTIIKPAKDGTYALLEDIEDLAWLQEGNTATVATKKLGTLDNFDFNIIRNNINIGQIKSTGLDLLDNRLDVGAIQFNVATTQTHAVAKIDWNDTYGTLEFGLKGGNVAYRLGQSSIVYVKHADNSGLTKGSVVYSAGSDGVNKTVRLAQANTESTSSKTFGVVAETVSGGAKAFCVTFGNIEGLNTSALTEGAAIYLSPTVAGGLTTTKPSGPDNMVLVGFCLRSHATQGVIFVKVQNGFELEELHDVAISSLANNNILAYEAGTTLWKNKTFAEVGLASGTGTLNYLPKWSNATGGLVNSQLFDNGNRIGINKVNPAFKVDILGATGDGIRYDTGTVSVVLGELSTKGFIGTTSNHDVNFVTSGITRMTLSSTGLGISTTNPAYRLDVTGTGHFTGSVIFDTVPSSLQDASSTNHLVRYSQWIASTSVKYLPTPVKTVSLSNITLSGTQTINGVSLIAADRILVIGQTTLSANGVYDVSAGAWTRSTDSDIDAEIRGFIVSISNGTYAGYKYINTNTSVITVGTTSIIYTEFSNLAEIDPVFVAWRDVSRTANTFHAAPSGLNGVATWRSLVPADIPSLDWSKITSGKPAFVLGTGTDNVMPRWNGTTGLEDGSFVDNNTSTIRYTVNSYGDFGVGTATSYAHFYVNSTRTTGDRHAFEDMSILNLEDSGLGYCSFDSKPTITNDNNYSHYIGYQSRLRYNGAGNVLDYVRGYDTDIRHNGTGTIANYSGIFLQEIGGVGAVTNSYGIYINPVFRGSNKNFSIYSLGGKSLFTDQVGIGTESLNGFNLRIARQITGVTTAYGVYQSGTVQSDVTTEAYGFRNNAATQAADFNLAFYYHYAATQSPLGGGSSITSQVGFLVSQSLTSAVNNYGFRGLLEYSVGQNRWNLHMGGTAYNYIQGHTGFGIETPTEKVDIVGNLKYSGTLKPINVAGTNGQFLKTNGTQDVWATITTSDIPNLSSWAGSTSITTLGTIMSGTWNGTTIAIARGGTGLTAIGTAGQMLRVNAGVLEYFTPTFISGNQTINITGDVLGSGTTAITATLAPITQANTGSFVKITLDTKGRVIGNTAVVASDITALLSSTSFLPYSTGAINYLPKWSNTTGSLVNSTIFDNGTNIGIGNSSPNTKVHLTGNLKIDGGTGYMLLGNVSGTYWIDVPSTSLNLYGTTVISKNNHDFEKKIALAGNYGTAGQVLTSQGPTAFPTWTTVSGGTLSNTQIGFGNASNLLSGNAALTWQEGRFISITGASANFNLGGSSGAGFVESVNGHLNLQARGAFGVLVQDGFFQVNELAGAGTRMVVADSDGKFSTQATPIPTLNQIISTHTGDFAGVLTSTTNNGGFAVKAIGGSDIGGVRRNFNDLDVYSATGIGVSNTNIISSYTVFLKANDANGRINLQCTNDIKLAGSFIELNSGLVKISSTPFKLAYSDFFGGTYTPANGEKILLTYDGSKSAFVLQKINVYLSGGISYLTL